MIIGLIVEILCYLNFGVTVPFRFFFFFILFGHTFFVFAKISIECSKTII